MLADEQRLMSASRVDAEAARARAIVQQMDDDRRFKAVAGMMGAGAVIECLFFLPFLLFWTRRFV